MASVGSEGAVQHSFRKNNHVQVNVSTLVTGRPEVPAASTDGLEVVAGSRWAGKLSQ